MTNRRQKRKRELEGLDSRPTSLFSDGARSRLVSNGSSGGRDSAYEELASSRKLTRLFSASSLQGHARTHMTNEEQRQLSSLLKQYKRKQITVEQLVNSLKIILDTPAKRQSILSIRNEVPSKHVALFDKLVVVQRLWPPNAATSRGVSPASVVDRSPTSPPPSRQGQARKVSREMSFRQEKVKPFKITIKPDVEGSLGFDVRGGADHGLGIFVCSVEEDSEAFEKGIRVGHVIRKANGVSFERIRRDNAIEILTDGSLKKIRLTVIPLGTSASDGVPGLSGQPVMYYTWMNKHGRSTSPPPEYKTGINLLHPNASLPRYRLKKLNMAKEDGRSLGISIRGGLEHGLGIYVSLVERNSTAHTYGLQVGDQIIDVNGVSYLNILHNEAAEMLRENEMLVMSLRSLGKIPERPIVPFDNIRRHRRKSTASAHEVPRQQPVAVPEKTAVPVSRRGLFLSAEQSRPNNSVRGRPTSPINHKPSAVFKQGFGTQLMFKGFQHAIHQSARASIDQQAKSALSREEVVTLAYYLDEYAERNLTVRQLVMALITLLDTLNKKRLITSIRSVVQPKDIDEFEKLVAPIEYQALKDSREVVGEVNHDVIDDYQFGISTFRDVIKNGVDGTDNGDEERQDGEGEARNYQTDDSDSIDCNPPLSHQNSQILSPMTTSKQLVVEDHLEARLGSLLAVANEPASARHTLERTANPSTVFAGRHAQRSQRSDGKIATQDVDDILEVLDTLVSDSDSDDGDTSTVEGEYNVQGREDDDIGEMRASIDLGIATASSSIQMLQMPVHRGTIPRAPPLPSSSLTSTPGQHAPVHKAIAALKPPSQGAQQAAAESPFVERRDSPRKIVQSQPTEAERTGTLDGAALDIPLFTSTPLHGMGEGTLDQSDMHSNDANSSVDTGSRSGSQGLLADTVRQRRLRIQPESTGNIQALLGDTTTALTDVTDTITVVTAADDSAATRTETTIRAGDVGPNGVVSTSNSFDLPDGINLQTRYVYNDTSEVAHAEVQYTDTDF